MGIPSVNTVRPAAAPPHRTKAAVRDLADTRVIDYPEPIAVSDTGYAALLAGMVAASRRFRDAAAASIAKRARTLFGTTEPTPNQLVKTTFAHRDFGRTKTKILDDPAACAMIDRALTAPADRIALLCTGFPMKVFNPLETEYGGHNTDLGDAAVILRFTELADVLNRFAQPLGKTFNVSVISDGIMNEGMFKVGGNTTAAYVSNLQRLTGRLGAHSHVTIEEFTTLLGARRSPYEAAVAAAKTHAHTHLPPAPNPADLATALTAATNQENDTYGTVSFTDVFNSTIGSVRYPEIEHLAHYYTTDFTTTYYLIIGSILWGQEIADTKTYETITEEFPETMRNDFLNDSRNLQKEVLAKAWHSTIEYLAVLNANRTTDILTALHPAGIRLTTRPKPGQIGAHTADQTNPALFSYHSIPVIAPSHKGKHVKLDFALRATALIGSYQPITHNGVAVAYLHPELDHTDLTALPWRRGTK